MNDELQEHGAYLHMNAGIHVNYELQESWCISTRDAWTRRSMVHIHTYELMGYMMHGAYIYM